jgi:hypothetical protein
MKDFLFLVCDVKNKKTINNNNKVCGGETPPHYNYTLSNYVIFKKKCSGPLFSVIIFNWMRKYTISGHYFPPSNKKNGGSKYGA